MFNVMVQSTCFYWIPSHYCTALAWQVGRSRNILAQGVIDAAMSQLAWLETAPVNNTKRWPTFGPGLDSLRASTGDWLARRLCHFCEEGVAKGSNAWRSRVVELRLSSIVVDQAAAMLGSMVYSCNATHMQQTRAHPSWFEDGALLAAAIPISEQLFSQDAVQESLAPQAEHRAKVGSGRSGEL